MEFKNYETVFIMTPILSESQVKDTVEKYAKILENAKSNIIFKSKSKLKKLAYPIQKKSMGIYQIFEFKALPSFIKELEKEYKRDEYIMRFLTVSLDKNAVQYNIDKKKIDAKRAQEKLNTNKNTENQDTDINKAEVKEAESKNIDSDILNKYDEPQQEKTEKKGDTNNENTTESTKSDKEINN